MSHVEGHPQVGPGHDDPGSDRSVDHGDTGVGLADQSALRRGLFEAIALLSHLIEEREMAEGVHRDEVEKRFTYHQPRGNQPEQYEELRARAKALAFYIIEVVPTSREQALALTSLENTIFWANAGIARRTPA